MTLKLLYLRNLRVTNIRNGAFDEPQFYDMQKLSIVNAPLMTLRKEMFKGLYNLSYLILDKLSLIKLGTSILATVPKVTMFSLSHCGEGKILLNNFFGVTTLHHLKLMEIYHCNLRSITKFSFRGIPNISVLRLTENQIDDIERNSFDIPLKTLTRLFLEKNKLETIPYGLFDINGTSESIFKLSLNPWNCDCDLEYLRKCIINSNEMQGRTFSEIVCKTPLEFEGKSLKNLDDLCEIANNVFELSADGEINIGGSNDMGLNIEEIVQNPQPQPQPQLENQIELTPIAEQELEKPEEPKDEKQNSKSNENPEKNIPNGLNLYCNQEYSDLKEKIILTMPKIDRPSSMYVENNDLFINDTLIGNKYAFIQIEEHFERNNNTTCFVNSVKFHLNLYTERPKIKTSETKRKLNRNKMYMFCWMEKFSKTITPSNCISLFIKVHRTYDQSPWILKKDQTRITVAIGLTAIFAPFLGFLISIILMKNVSDVTMQ